MSAASAVRHCMHVYASYFAILSANAGRPDTPACTNMDICMYMGARTQAYVHF